MELRNGSAVQQEEKEEGEEEEEEKETELLVPHAKKPRVQGRPSSNQVDD